MHQTSTESIRALATILAPVGVGSIGGLLLGWRWMIGAEAELERSGEYACGLIAIPYLGGGLFIGGGVGLLVAILALWKTGQL